MFADLYEGEVNHGARTPNIDDSDTELKQVTAVTTASGELKFVSGEDDSGDDLLASKRR